MGDSYKERDPRAPAWAQSAIIAELHKDDSDLMTDYFASSVHKRVILAWSKHRRDLFPELRAAALTFEPTRFRAPGCDDHHVYVALAGDVQSNGAAYWKGQISPWHKDQDRRFDRPEEAVAYMREHAPDPLVLSVDGHDVSFVWAHGIKSYEHREKWSLGHGYYLGADRYSGLRHIFAPHSRDTNLGAPASILADGRPVFRGSAGRPDSRFRAINLIESGGNSSFHALDLTFTKRFSAGLQFNTTYSWSHALADHDAGWPLADAGTLMDATNRRRDYGNSSTDQRHRFVLQGLYAPKYAARGLRWINGFEFSSMTFMNSGFPINIQAGADLNLDLVLNDRPCASWGASTARSSSGTRRRNVSVTGPRRARRRHESRGSRSPGVVG